jgi:serine/threonine protein kinase
MTLAIGQTLQDRYQIVALLGSGGMGAVYRAYDARLQQDVAIKENTMAVPESRKQFEREALVLAQMRHANLPRVIDHFITPDGAQYLVMDYITGDDLGQIIDRTGPLPEAEAIAWISQVCSALEYLHSQQPPIIHRDIKPQNIKVTPKGEVFLVDFGLAKLGEGSKTTIGALGVTPGFSPPEQYAFIGTDARSDVYALGATLYALLTGQTPPESVILQFGEKQLVPPRQVNSTVSPTVQEAVLKAMAPRRTDRPQTVAEFRNMLATGAAERPALPPTKVTLPKPAGQKRFLPLAGVAAILAVVVVICLGVLIAARSLWTIFPLSITLPSPTASITATPTVTREIASPTVEPTSTPATIPTTAPSPSSVPSPAPTAAPTATPTTRPVTAPVLIEPSDGQEVKQATFRWKGTPPTGYAYIIEAISDDGKTRVVSPPVVGTSWIGDIPASKAGGWQWSIQVIRQHDSHAVAVSKPVHFWYQPMPGGGPYGPYGQNLPVPPALVEMIEQSMGVGANIELSVAWGLIAGLCGILLVGLIRRRF